MYAPDWLVGKWWHQACSLCLLAVYAVIVLHDSASLVTDGTFVAASLATVVDGDLVARYEVRVRVAYLNDTQHINKTYVYAHDYDAAEACKALQRCIAANTCEAVHVYYVADRPHIASVGHAVYWLRQSTALTLLVVSLLALTVVLASACTRKEHADEITV